MARCGNRPQREHRKGRRGCKGGFLVFLFTRHGNKDKVLTVYAMAFFCLWIFSLKGRRGCRLYGGWPLVALLQLVEMEWGRLVGEPPNLRVHR